MRRKEEKTAPSLNVELLRDVVMHVSARGSVPAEELKKEFGDAGFNESIAILYRTYRVFREVWRDAEGSRVQHYEWADRRFSRPEISKMPKELGFLVELSNATRPRYTDFQLVCVKCRWTTVVSAAIPGEKDGDPRRFERDFKGDVVLPAYGLRAMAQVAMPQIGKEAAIANRIGFSSVHVAIADVNIKVIHYPVVENRPGGGQGKGLTPTETMPPGTEFVIEAMIPTSQLSVTEYLRLLRHSGKFVRFSPSRSAGRGEFEVLEVLQ